jgi:hypothetical protein
MELARQYLQLLYILSQVQMAMSAREIAEREYVYYTPPGHFLSLQNLANSVAARLLFLIRGDLVEAHYTKRRGHLVYSITDAGRVVLQSSGVVFQKISV